MAKGESPDFRSVYQEFYSDEITLAKDTVNCAGKGFCAGTIGGSIYHFAKAFRNGVGGTGTKLASGFSAARAHGPRVGGFLALFPLVVSVSQYALYRLRGRKPDNYLTETATFAVGGAVMWAPRGLVSASRAALFVGAIPPTVTALGALTDPSNRTPS